MRPRSIKIFERIYWLNIALAVASLGWVYGRIDRIIPSLPADAPAMAGHLIYGIMIAVGVVTIGIKLLLWFFIARRGSNTARWIFVILFVLAIAGIIRTVGLYERGEMSIVGMGLWGSDMLTRIMCVCLLFRHDAAIWFDRRPMPRDLHDTFS